MSSKLNAAIPALIGVIVVACAPAGQPAGGGATSPPGATGQPAAAARSGGTLRVGQSAGDIGTADPHYASGTQDRALVDMVFNGLVRYKPGDATQFEPDLATELPQSATDG